MVAEGVAEGYLNSGYLNSRESGPARVLILMGSQSDAATMKHAIDTLEALAVGHEALITSAHRTPTRMVETASMAETRGYKAIIAGAGGSAHLPGMCASETMLPVFAVAVPSTSNAVNDMAAIYSNICMPGGVPLMYMGLGKAGAQNAALGAARMLAQSDRELYGRLFRWMKEQEDSIPLRPTFKKDS